MNFLEILYTKFFVLNPKYADIFNQTFILYRSNISAYNIHQMIQSTIGQIKSTMKQAMAETTDPAAVGKKIANCFRLCFFCNEVNYFKSIIIFKYSSNFIFFFPKQVMTNTHTISPLYSFHITSDL